MAYNDNNDNNITQYPENERDNYHNCYVESEDILLSICEYKNVIRGNLPPAGIETFKQAVADVLFRYGQGQYHNDNTHFQRYRPITININIVGLPSDAEQRNWAEGTRVVRERYPNEVTHDTQEHKLTPEQLRIVYIQIFEEIFEKDDDGPGYHTSDNTNFVFGNYYMNSCERRRNSEYLYPQYGHEQITFGDRIRDIWNGIIHSTSWETDPLLIDLNGDGIKTTTIAMGDFFDHEGDGFAELSAWVDENDGVLFVDKNNNGELDNGTELFGENYTKSNNTLATDAFDALSDLDSNNDGVIDSNDTHFSDIKIMKGDGTVLSLDDANITSISLYATSVNQIDDNGNTKVATGTYTKSDNTKGEVGSYTLQSDKTYSIFTDYITETQEVSQLPDVFGFGKVYDLHQAMLRDNSNTLKTLVQTFISATESNRETILEQIILKWTGVENVQTNSRGENVNAQHLAVLEAFKGETFYSTYEEGQNNEHPENPNLRAGRLIETAYQSLKAYVYSELMGQTVVDDLIQLIGLNQNGYDLSDVISQLQDEIVEDATAGKIRVAQFAKVIKGLGMEDEIKLFDPLDDNCFYTTFTSNDRELKWEIDSFGKVLLTTPGIGEFNDQIGTAGDDAYRIDYTNGNYLRALSGNDVVYGGEYDDIIETCSGDDLLDGGAGDDYLRGQENNDTIFGGAGDDTLRGEAGNDILFGDAGDDLIFGDDNYKGEYNNDIIRGGQGNDTIISYFGDDAFIYDRGDGQDTIYESEGVDTIYFGNNITWSDLQFTRNNNDMIITLLDNNEPTTDTITISGWFENFQGDNTLRYNNQRIELFKFKDGTVHNMGEIQVSDSINYFTYNTNEGNDITTADNYNSVVNILERGNFITMGENSVNTINISQTNNIDVVHLYKTTSNDTIVLSEDYQLSNAVFEKYADRLQISFKNQSARIRVHYENNCSINIQFANENLITDVTPYLTYIETSEDITMAENMDIVKLLGENDITVIGNNKANKIITNSGDSIIEGKGGNDNIESTKGGNDTYIFNLGDGKDTIKDKGGNDRIVLGEDFNTSNTYGVKCLHNNDMMIRFNDNSDDRITIKEFYKPNNSQKIETIEFYDGTIITDFTPYVKEWQDRNSIDISNETIVKNAQLVEDTHASMTGNNKNNSFTGNNGDNSFYGGTGNDKLKDKNKTNEKFYYNLGDGNDTIEDIGGVDAIIFGSGITSSMINMTRNGNNLVITFANQTGQITINSYFSNYDNRVEILKFSDGTIIDNFEPYINGVENGLTILDYQQGSVVIENESSITLTGNGNAYVFGNTNNNTVTGNSGNNTYALGGGDDTVTDILGGNDTYLYNVNNGNDVITDLGGVDTIRFGKNIYSSDLIFKQNEYNLEITFANREGSLTINNYFQNDNYKIETLVFDDNTTISDVSNLLSQITVFNDYQLSENSGIEVIKLSSNGGNITVSGNSANNTFIGNSSNNTYVYNLGGGLDTIIDNGGVDTIRFGQGITTENLRFAKNNNDLQILINDNLNEGLIIKDYFVQDNENNYLNKIERFEFADETVITDLTNYLKTVISEEDITIPIGYDELILTGHNDINVIGNSGNNTIYGNEGENTIQGGLGNDTLIDGYYSNDTYIYNIGDGYDVIDDMGGINQLILGAGINYSNIEDYRLDNDVVMNFKNSNEEIIGGITIKDTYANNHGIINQIYFTDNEMMYEYNPWMLLDYKSYGNVDNTNSSHIGLYLLGNDNTSVTGSDYISEVIYGNSGNNTIMAGGGDDIINDTEGGNDTYIYNYEDGTDWITDVGGVDTVVFGEELTIEDSVFTRVENNLQITFNNIWGRVEIVDYFASNDNKIESLQFTDGTITDVTSYLNAVQQEMTSFDGGDDIEMGDFEEQQNFILPIAA